MVLYNLIEYYRGGTPRRGNFSGFVESIESGKFDILRFTNLPISGSVLDYTCYNQLWYLDYAEEPYPSDEFKIFKYFVFMTGDGTEKNNLGEFSKFLEKYEVIVEAPTNFSASGLSGNYSGMIFIGRKKRT